MAQEAPGLKRLTLNNHFQVRSKQRPEAIKVRGAGLPVRHYVFEI